MDLENLRPKPTGYDDVGALKRRAALKRPRRLAKLAAMRTFARAVCLALPFALALPALATPATADAAEGDEEYTLAADVKVEVRQENGKVVTHRGEVPVLEMDHKFEFEGEGHFHELTLNIKKENSKKVKVKLAYDRDATPIIAPFTTDFTIKKREILRADDIALALTIKIKKIKPKDTSRSDEDKIDHEEDDNPLGELEIRDDKKKKKKKKK